MPIEVESPEQLGYDTITNNLSESSVSDRRLADLGLDLSFASGDGLDRLLLCYGDHLGDPRLREAVAAGGSGLHADDVLVTPGAAAALFATATSLLEAGDHAVIVRTNYATNLETPRAIGAAIASSSVAPQMNICSFAASRVSNNAGSLHTAHPTRKPGRPYAFDIDDTLITRSESAAAIGSCVPWVRSR